MKAIVLSMSLLGLVVGCGVQHSETISPPKKSTTTSKSTLTPSSEGKAYMLDTEPSDAKGVIDVRKETKDGDMVTVVGRVGGESKPFTKDRASFVIIDPSLKPTEGCDTPWDYCEYKPEERAAARLTVKFVDAEGQTLKTGARGLFGLEPLSTVIVQGKVQRDDKNNVIVVARTIYVR
jgi:hypothetical protein